MFSTTVSIEMMQPLSCIITFADKLASVLAEKNQTKMVSMITSSAKLLRCQMKDSFDYNYVKNAKIVANYEPHIIKNVIEEATTIMRYLAEAKKLKFDIQSLVDNRVKLMIDSQRLLQVLIHLLSNAIKFSGDSQTITIEIDIISQMLIFKVRDQGIGISRENQEKLFTPYF